MISPSFRQCNHRSIRVIRVYNHDILWLHVGMPTLKYRQKFFWCSMCFTWSWLVTLDVCMRHCHYIVCAEQKKEDYDSSALTPGVRGQLQWLLVMWLPYPQKNYWLYFLLVAFWSCSRADDMLSILFMKNKNAGMRWWPVKTGLVFCSGFAAVVVVRVQGVIRLLYDQVPLSFTTV